MNCCLNWNRNKNKKENEEINHYKDVIYKYPDDVHMILLTESYKAMQI